MRSIPSFFQARSLALALGAGLMFAAATAADNTTSTSTPAKDDALAAAKKLAAQPNYSWRSTVVVPENAQFKPGPTEGKTEKDGFTQLTLHFGDNTTEAVLKGDKGAAPNSDGDWKLASELEDSEGPGRFLGRMMRFFKTPAAQAVDLVSATKDLKKDGDILSGDLTDEGAKAQFRFGQPKNPKGSVKFWTKDGQLTKFEVKVQAKVEFNGEERDSERTTTTEIKDVGTTKLTVPDAAAKKLQ